MDWDTNFHGVAVRCKNRVIQIRTDERLREWLTEPKDRALELADYARELYQREMGSQIGITRDSLAIEILGHVYVENLAELAEQCSGILTEGMRARLREAAGRVRSHTEVIDCGEKAVDGNRFLWDRMETVKPAVYGFFCAVGV